MFGDRRTMNTPKGKRASLLRTDVFGTLKRGSRSLQYILAVTSGLGLIGGTLGLGFFVFQVIRFWGQGETIQVSGLLSPWC